MEKSLCCMQNVSNLDEFKQMLESCKAKADIKKIMFNSIYTITRDLHALKNVSRHVSSTFQQCSDMANELSLISQCEDDDVLLVGDNFQNIASKELVVNTMVYANQSSDIWRRGMLVEISDEPLPERKFLVKFDDKASNPLVFPSKKIAFGQPPVENLNIGARVIGYYNKDEAGSAPSWLLGVVAEFPSFKNDKRYLIFFDDGYAQYCQSSEVRKVYGQSKFVWEDIKTQNSFLVMDYLKQYPNRPMVALRAGHCIKVESNGAWLSAVVTDVDASLVKVLYTTTARRTEWLYRGSRRLQPLFLELAKAESSQKLGRTPRFSTDPKRHNKGAYVVYTVQSDEASQDNVECIDLDPEPGVGVKKCVARKSTNGSQSQSSVASSSTESDSQILSKYDHHFGKSGGMLKDIDRSLIPVSLSPRWNKRMCTRCSPVCVARCGDDPSKFKGFNPLLIPLLYGWQRKIVKPAHARKRIVVYTAQCGRNLKTIDELDQCLMQCNSQLTIDLFSFDFHICTDQEFVVTRNLIDVKDFSFGKENVPIPCINSLDRIFPEYIEYSTKRIPGKGVNLNTDPAFLGGCNCVDNCRDRTKCQCIQLTVEATECIPNGRDAKAGYKHRRLKQPIVTGVYECNSNCSCDHRCHNKVIQNGLSLRLQIFKTEKKGWGLRCLDDIPAGGFICVYSGQILTDDTANEDGQLYGDEYLADLDHIDVVEKEKEGYESDVRMDDDEEDEEEDEESCGEENNDEDKEEKFDWLKKVHMNPDIVKRTVARRRSSRRTAPVNLRESGGRVAKKSKKVKVSASRNVADNKPEPVEFDTKGEKMSDVEVNEKDKEKSVLLEFPGPDKKLFGCREESEDKPDGSRSEFPPTSVTTSADSSCCKFDDADDRTFDEDDDLEIEIDDDDVISETDDIVEESTSSRADETSRNNSDGRDGGEEATRFFGKFAEPMEVDEVDLADSRQSEERSVETPAEPNNLDAADAIRAEEPSLTPLTDPTQKKKSGNLKMNTRRLYGEETVYIIDAKSIGNIGRYFNHSCSPNIFVQNVFYDTHDLRFPWVAFFAKKSIRAGTELTWNYNYEVGSVPGKKLACYCGSAECNGRLL